MTRVAAVEVSLRAGTARDRDDLAHLARSAVPPTYLELVLEPVVSCDEGAEERVIVAVADGDRVVGFALYRLVAAARGAGQLQAIAVDGDVRRCGIGRLLVSAALAALRDAGARFTLVELPDDRALDAMAALVASAGFVEECRASDLVRDGVAMRYLRHDPPR
jgi:ribosomal protein S18 acetylase RimI-like enzyme